MSGLETALIILVTIWTIIFGIIAIAIFIIFLNIRKALKKANQILDETEAKAKSVDLPSKIVIASILGFMAKNSFQTLKGFFKKEK